MIKDVPKSLDEALKAFQEVKDRLMSERLEETKTYYKQHVGIKIEGTSNDSDEILNKLKEKQAQMAEELKQFDNYKVCKLDFEDLNKMSNVKIDDKGDLELGKQSELDS